MTNPSIGKSLLRIGRGRIILDFRGRDSNHPNIKTQKEVLSSVNGLEVCTNKIFHVKVGHANKESKGESRGEEEMTYIMLGLWRRKYVEGLPS